MIKKLSTLVVLLSLSIATFAGDYFTLGLKAGYSTSLKDDSKDVKFEGSNGFNAGFMARFGNKFFVEPELLYNYQQQNTTYNFAGVSAEGSTYKNSSIDIPVLFGYKFLDVKIFKMSAMIGPRFRLDAGTKFSDFDNVKTNVEKSSIGLDCGVAFDVLNFIVDFRYNLMPSIASYKINNETVNFDPTNAFEVSLAFKLW